MSCSMEKRVYQVWKGRNKFLLGGRLIFGPDARSLFVSTSLIIVPVIIFCIYVGKHLLHEFPSYNAGYAIIVAPFVFTIYTTYKNFRYRADNRFNVYDRGCLDNFKEVFFTMIKPSQNKFRAITQEAQQPPPATSLESGPEDSGPEDRRMKVEDDMDIGGDFLKISQRHDIKDTESGHSNSIEVNSVLASHSERYSN